MRNGTFRKGVAESGTGLRVFIDLLSEFVEDAPMITHRLSSHLVSAFLAIWTGVYSSFGAQHPFGWDRIEPSAYPGAYWWWMGSAVNEIELERDIAALSDVGIKTLRLDAIYSAEGSSVPEIPYLSDDWKRAAKTALDIARDKGVTLDFWGNGWPYGGPQMSPENAARRLEWDDGLAGMVVEETKVLEQDDGYPIVSVSILPSGSMIDEARVLSEMLVEDKKRWEIPPGTWDVYVFRNGYTKMQVKRAAPGGEGPVADHYSRAALAEYLQPLDRLMEVLGKGAFDTTHFDSFEVHGANWTGQFLDFFSAKRDYDLAPYLPALISDSTGALANRVRHDYRMTILEILTEEFVLPWIEWSHSQGMKTSYQAHGSPGHLVDLYGLSDQPDTEAFGRVGMSTDGRGAEGGGYLCSKFASSAAHLNGRPHTSAETFTWLEDHFCVSLDRMRKEIDMYFLAGVNRMMFHSCTYTPSDVPFPGWLYYASTNVDRCQPWWKHLPSYTEYVARIQAVLQEGAPGEDLLLLYPIHDLWFDNDGASNLLQYCQVHNTANWLHRVGKHAAETAQWLWERGWMFDWCSDRNLAKQIRYEEGEMVCGDGRYKALIVPECRWMSGEALGTIRALAAQGANVIFLGSAPQAVPTGKPTESIDVLAPEERKKAVSPNARSPQFLETQEELDEALARSGARRERMADLGLLPIRRRGDAGTSYFVSNRTDRDFEGWLPLSAEGEKVVVGDPLTGTYGTARTRNSSGSLECRVRIQASRSLVLRAGGDSESSDAFQFFLEAPEQSLAVEGPWGLTWTDPNGESHSQSIAKLASWTVVPGLELFGGTVVYETEFDLSLDQAKQRWRLDLGTLHESADVFINGTHIGRVWTTPNEIDLGNVFVSGKNVLRVEVTNLLANRMIALEREDGFFKMTDRHLFVNYAYQPFNAAEWTPLPSGLLGPVRLLSMTPVSD